MTETETKSKIVEEAIEHLTEVVEEAVEKLEEAKSEETKPTLTDEQVEALIRDCIAKCQERGTVIKAGEWGAEFK